MSQLEVTICIMLYLYTGMCVLSFIYNKQTSIQKEKYWTGISEPFFIILLWPMAVFFIIVCYLPILLFRPPVTAMIIIREIYDRKSKIVVK